MKRLKTIAVIIVSVGGIFSLIPIIFYIFNFSGTLSTETTVWGEFGDFVSGTINPIIGLINLALLMVLTIYVAKFDSHRQFNEYRFQAYIELCKKFDDVENTSKDLFELKEYIDVFNFNNQFLFPRESNSIFNELSKKLIEDVEKLAIIKEDVEDKIESGEIKISQIPKSLGRRLEDALKDMPRIETEESMALKDFNKSKNNIIGFIQAVMIESDFKIYKIKKN